MSSVLLVDDEVELCDLLAMQITDSNHEVKNVYNAHDALNLLESNTFDVLVTDIKMPGMDGFQMIKEIKNRNFKVPETIYVITGYSEYDEEEIISLGVKRVFLKPHQLFDLLSVL